MKNKNFELICVIVGLISGAGFASGQELMTFFIPYGDFAVAGVILTGVIIFLFCWAIMRICIRDNISDYKQFMSKLFGKRLGMLFNYLVLAFVGVLFFAMLAASGALLHQSMGFNYSAGVIVTAALCFVVFLFGVKGFVQINAALVPLMCVCFFVLGVITVLTDSREAFIQLEAVEFITDSFFASAFIYASYNLISAVPILTKLSVEFDDKSARNSAFISAVILTVILLLFVPSLAARAEILSAVEIPMLVIVSDLGLLLEYLYIFVMFIAIFTTAIADGFILTDYLCSRLKLNKTAVKALVCALGSLAAHAGFSTIIENVYPIFGAVAIIEVSVVLFHFFKPVKRNGFESQFPPK